MSTPEITLTSEEIARIVTHMNEDHADSVLAYAQHFGQKPEAREAQILALDSNTLTIQVKIASELLSIQIPFEHPLKSAHDAHMKMIQMSKAAKRALKV